MRADVKAIAIEAAEYLKQKNPNVEVTVCDRESGETIIIKSQPPILK